MAVASLDGRKLRVHIIDAPTQVPPAELIIMTKLKAGIA
jgi:hypothetical protein